MIEHEVIWESLRSMHRSEQKYRKKLLIDGFILKLLESLSNDLHADPFKLCFRLIQDQLTISEIFILRQQNHDYATVFKSTIPTEEGHMWPLIGPFRRSQQGRGSIIFNTKLIPVLRNFTPVYNHNIISMVTSSFQWGEQRFILVISRSEIGGFDHADEELIHSLARLLSTQEDRFKLGIDDKTTEVSNLLNQSMSHRIDDPEKTVVDHRIHDLSSTKLDTYTVLEEVNWLVISDEQIYNGFSLVNRYQITKRLGQGGQAVVYKAFDRLINRPVAIKLMMSQGIPQQQTFEAAIREASLAANINHPNVVKIYDIGFVSNDQQPFIVMEYLEGSDLHEVLRKQGRLPANQVLSLMISVLAALGEAHRLGLVHRDLKPHNLLLSHLGQSGDQLKILDFGLAQLTEQENTNPDKISGTLAYLAPEYLRNQIIGPQIDVYQIGLILIEAITGQRVFNDESSYKTMLDICDGQWALTPMIANSKLGGILLKATHLNPEFRYQDGLEFSQALSSLSLEEIRQLESSLDKLNHHESK